MRFLFSFSENDFSSRSCDFIRRPSDEFQRKSEKFASDERGFSSGTASHGRRPVDVASDGSQQQSSIDFHVERREQFDQNQYDFLSLSVTRRTTFCRFSSSAEDLHEKPHASSSSTVVATNFFASNVDKKAEILRRVRGVSPSIFTFPSFESFSAIKSRRTNRQRK